MGWSPRPKRRALLKINELVEKMETLKSFEEYFIKEKYSGGKL